MVANLPDPNMFNVSRTMGIVNPPQANMNVDFQRGDGTVVTSTSRYRVTSDEQSSNITIFHDLILGVPGGGDPSEVIIATFDIPVGAGLQSSGLFNRQEYNVICQVVEYRSISTGPNYVVQSALEPYEISSTSASSAIPRMSMRVAPGTSDNPYTSESLSSVAFADGESVRVQLSV